MKKIVAVLIILSVVCYEVYKVYNYGGSPYLGKYESLENSTTLLLKRNNKCVLIGKDYKDTFYEYGKYNIKNNEIKIHFNKNDNDNSNLEGKFEGSSIKIFNKLEEENNIYYKE